MSTTGLRTGAMREFEQARRQAKWNQLTARFLGKDDTVMEFEAIRSRLRHQNPMYKGIQQIQVDHVVGSVGRYHEFSRQFLPLNDSLRERWVKVNAYAEEHGWPPIEAYKVGDVYFVKDGNHRVSVSSQMGIPTIEAHVWEFPSEISIGANDSFDEVLIRLGEKEFMEKTGLNEQIPNHQIHFTSPGRYSELFAQIESLRHALAIIDGEEMSYQEATLAWYDMIYLPTVQIIHETGLVKEFSGRTEADLFVWLSQKREPLREQYGDYENLADLANILAQAYKEQGINKVARQIRRFLGDDKALPPLDGPEESSKGIQGVENVEEKL